MKEMDIAESLVTNQKGNGGRFGKAVTVEKYRDIKKIFKEDKIIPVITVVLYFGEKPWDGPRSLKDMMGWKGEEAESYIQDYKMNLLIPSEMKDAEIETLQSSLREVFYFLKYAGDWKKLEKILDKNERF